VSFSIYEKREILAEQILLRLEVTREHFKLFPFALTKRSFLFEMARRHIRTKIVVSRIQK